MRLEIIYENWAPSKKNLFIVSKVFLSLKTLGFAWFRPPVLPENIISIYPVHTSSLDVILGVYLMSCAMLFMFWR